MRAKNMEEYYGELKKLKDPHFQENNGSYVNNNGYRDKVVEGEQELLKHVEMGWEVVKELADGRFIVRVAKNNSRFRGVLDALAHPIGK